MKISEEMIEYVDYVISFIDGNSTDWLIIRKELIGILPPKLRSMFSRRHYSSKLTQINDLDYAIIEYWEEKTDDRLFIDKSKIHPEKTWKKNPKGWGLFEINRKRHEQAKNKRTSQASNRRTNKASNV